MVTQLINRGYRYERKFLVEGLDHVQARMLVRRHPSMFYNPFPPRAINNLYLDTIDLDNYYANVDGQQERQKVRIRWYGSLFGEIKKPNLEIKFKKGMVGSKFVYPLRSFKFGNGFNRDQEELLLSASNLPGEIQLITQNMQVVLCNRYERQYFATRDQRFRLTIDNEMSYYQVKGYNNQFRNLFRDNRNIIVEIKYNQELDTQADKIAGFFPFQVTKNSKYVTGIESVY